MLQYALFNKYYTPSGMEIGLSNYYTKGEVDKLIQDVISGDIDLSNYYTKSEVNNINNLFNYYTKNETDLLLDEKVDSSYVENAFTSYDEHLSSLDNTINSKQDTLISGTNIKTINSQSILGSGNIDISGNDSSWILNEQDGWDYCIKVENVNHYTYNKLYHVLIRLNITIPVNLTSGNFYRSEVISLDMSRISELNGAILLNITANAWKQGYPMLMSASYSNNKLNYYLISGASRDASVYNAYINLYFTKYEEE